MLHFSGLLWGEGLRNKHSVALNHEELTAQKKMETIKYLRIGNRLNYTKNSRHGKMFTKKKKVNAISNVKKKANYKAVYRTHFFLGESKQFWGIGFILSIEKICKDRY